MSHLCICSNVHSYKIYIILILISTKKKNCNYSFELIQINTMKITAYLCMISYCRLFIIFVFFFVETIIPVCPPACGQQSSHMRSSSIKNSINISFMIAMCLYLIQYYF